MVARPFLAGLRAHAVGDAQHDGKWSRKGGAGCGNRECLEVLDVAAVVARHARGQVVVGRDREGGRDPNLSHFFPGHRFRKPGARVDGNRHGRRERRATLDDGCRHQEEPRCDDHLAQRDAAARVGSARSEENDPPRREGVKVRRSPCGRRR